MQFNQHTNLQGLHAPFAASQSSWLRYDDDKAIERYSNRNRKLLGSELHDYARSQIMLCQKVTSITNLVKDISTFIFSKYTALEKTDVGIAIIKDVKRLPTEVFETLKMHINDAIGFKMEAEVVLYYSERFFGTADAISFRNNFLRIHDLKTGEHPVDMEQLLVYVALFCLEYKVDPADIEVELRIYQKHEVAVYNPAIDEIAPVIDKIIHLNKLLINLDEEV